MKASDILICPWHDLPTNSHFHISEIKMLCSNVSAECAVSRIMCFEAVLHTTLLRAFREKRTNYRKESCLPFVCGEVIFFCSLLGYFHFKKVQIKKC